MSMSTEMTDPVTPVLPSDKRAVQPKSIYKDDKIKDKMMRLSSDKAITIKEQKNES